MTKKVPLDLQEAYEEVMSLFMNRVPVTEMNFGKVVADDLMGYGSTKEELIRNIREYQRFIQVQEDQSKGLEMNFKRDPIHKYLSEDKRSAIIVEEITIRIDSNDSVSEFTIRLSIAMYKKAGQWKMVHFHGSVPVETEKEDTWHLKEWEKEKEKLQTLVDEQTADLQAKNRELEVETSLERVRARTMAMHKTDELQDVINTVYQQLLKLEIEITGGAFIVINSDIDSELVCWGAGGTADYIEKVHIPHMELPIYTDLIKGIKKGPGFFTESFTREEKILFFEELFRLPPYNKATENRKKEVQSRPGGYTRSCIVSPYTSIFIINHHGRPFTKEENETLKRMGKVFEQTYTRFLDLQKAEGQAREAEIEAALERIRTASMAMHQTDDISDVVLVFFRQLKELNIHFVQSWITVFHLDEGYFDIWLSPLDGIYDEPTHLQMPSALFEDTSIKAWREGKTFSYLSFKTKQEVEALFKACDEATDSNYFSQLQKKLQLERLEFTDANYKYGTVSKSGDVPATEEEEEILHRFAKVFEQTYTRFLDLQKAEDRAKEAQIEAALERARVQSMLMQHSDEIDTVSNVFHEQLILLGIPSEFSYVWLPDEDNETHQFWASWSEGIPGESTLRSKQITYPLDKSEPYTAACFEAWSTPEVVLEEFIPPSDVAGFFEVWHELLDGAEQLKAEFFPDGIFYSEAYMRYGCFGINIRRKLSEEEKNILQRFSIEFERAYTRFLDLQKAEAQAREAQIETALEKVRSRTMAMQSSDELTEAATEMFSKIEDLGLNPWSCGFNIFNDDKTVISQWVSTGDGRPIEPFDTPATQGIFKRIVEQSENDGPLYIEKMEGKKLKDTYKYMASLPTLDKIFEELDAAGIELPKKQVDHAAYFKHGYLMFITYEETPEFHSIFKRFAKVFEQTYTRFLDLQKAEAQTHEAKIETALEKIRSRSMGMQSSEELPEVANLMFLEIQNLGINAWSCGYCILEEDRKSSICIMSSEGTIQKPFLLPHIGEESFEEWDDFVHSEETFFTQELKDDAIESHYDFMTSLPQLKPIFQDLKDAGLSLPTYQINHLAKFSDGFLLFITYEPVPDAHDIFKRFTAVFDQTYTRFLDLQKSEKRAHEAEVELSLERVRSQVTAMQKSSDLFDIVVNMRKEFISLGHEADYFWHMTWGPDSYDMSMTSEDGNRIGMAIKIPKFVHEAIHGLAEWEKGTDPVYVLALNGDDAWDYIENMNTHGKYEQADPNAPTEEDIHEIGGLTFIIARTSHGEIGYSLPGKVMDPPQEALDTLVRFAGVFDLAYQRFEDLQEAEQQAKLIREERDRLEATLNELHATQDQLVQQEKLASLGQLTAGIAHEIKNPLNFVNNFSDLSVELIEEIREEMRRMTEDRGRGTPPLLREESEGEAGARGVFEKASGDSQPQVPEIDSSSSNTPLNPLSRGDGDPSLDGSARGVSGMASDDTFDPDLILDILDDIEANLKTIHKHGSRADSIVKSMLQHSRGGDGTMEPTPLNPLIKEYVNLAFHGMRAGKNPIDVDIDMKLDGKIGEVPLVAEDFSRVILNLVNNAFDAMGEKAPKDRDYEKHVAKGKNEKSPLEGGAGAIAEVGDVATSSYQPKLSIRTHQKQNTITIEVEDNGPGIPEEIKDKILQPFFTTKKGTAGTGLGLSITNDIVKAHRGNFDIFSKPGKTVFKIILTK